MEYRYIYATLVLALGWGALIAHKARAEAFLPEDATRPVVVELFTSQGCSSCPPADMLLGELAQRGGANILPLSFHVDYWDYIGWKDPFSRPEFTHRQQAYSAAMGLRNIYTPQVVVDGSYDVTGSDRAGVLHAIKESAKHPATASISVADAADGALKVTVRRAKNAQAKLWLAGYDARHETAVGNGENGGRKLVNYNVVRVMTPLGPLTGEETEFTLTRPAYDGAVLLVQDGQTGRILGAKKL